MASRPMFKRYLDKFKFRNQIPTLVDADVLGFLIAKVPRQLHQPQVLKPVLNADDSVRLEGLDNHGMGTVFEELIRRFNEENNEEAGEHFTPQGTWCNSWCALSCFLLQMRSGPPPTSSTTARAAPAGC